MNFELPHSLLVLAALSLAASCGDTVVTGTNDLAMKDASVPLDALSNATDFATSDSSVAGDLSTSPDATSRVPQYHRADDSACSTPAPAGSCILMQNFFPCNHDSDCSKGLNGRCVESNGGALTCFCSYDTCTHDADCAKGQLCVCHGSAYSAGVGNTCMPGNCRIDSDCGEGGYCSPSHGNMGCGGVTGYYCHTRSDTCVDDSDCPVQNGPMVCAWSAGDNRWSCQMQLLCP